MNLKEPALHSDKEKWNKILFLVNQNLTLLQSNPGQQFKRLSAQRIITENLFILIIQYIGLGFGTLSIHPTLLWFASGTSCAYIFLRGYSVLPGIWLGTFLAYLLAKAGFWAAFFCGTLFSLQAVLLLWFCYQFLGPTLIFYQWNTFILFTLYTSVLTALISSGLLYICYSSLPASVSFIKMGLHWWLANFNGILIFATSLVTFDAYFLDVYASKQLKKLGLIFGLFALLILTLVLNHSSIFIIVLSPLIICFSLALSWFLGWCGAIASIFLLSTLICFSEFVGTKFFVFYSGDQVLFLLQVCLCIYALLSLGVALYSQDTSK